MGRPRNEHPHVCSICQREFRKGGVAGPPALCPAHYHRARRESPAADAPEVLVDHEGAERVYITPTAAGRLRREFARAQKARPGLRFASWLGDFVIAALDSDP
ncbi:MAG: hypothetical protein WAZ94_15040 [Phycisphaerales bacterium]|nr:hypothetical protein [Chloroflexota bacterium]